MLIQEKILPGQQTRLHAMLKLCLISGRAFLLVVVDM